ncbi:MAG: UDP-N-acetylmuramate dehydrogenase [Actinobacteria bacterium]|uniref:UDP-N-acetylmuramate dehydrogenase n=1 Tax=freshwater metagenome TaxID=449393 RepID=A0A6J7GVE1_9ZZZZ|nr:UDP-N-acetylmuramate dehydrogenase [Actinomycetota bacterium]
MTTFAELTTLRVGGGARRWVEARTSQEIVDAATAAQAAAEPWFALGGGSNVVVSDEEFQGTVIRVLNDGIQIDGEGTQHTLVHVQAGHRWDDFVSWAVLNGLAGVEAMSGIPGTVGGAPVQNIGAYGQELAEVVHSLTFWDAELGDVVTLTRADLDFAFRHSVLKAGRRGIVLDITFALWRVGESSQALSKPIMFEQLSSALGVAMGASEPLGAVRARVLELRAAKGMVLDTNDPDTASVGSFFVNPIVSERFARSLPPDAPQFPVGEDEPPRYLAPGEEVPPLSTRQRGVKLSAAWLIENAGVRKGFALPGSGAGISSKHALAITNRGTATANDVLQLATYVQSLVQSAFGVLLLPEPTLVGLSL